MTEESYQQARKLMQQANYLRGKITKYKQEVGSWTKLEDWNRRELRPLQADAAKKNLERNMKLLERVKAAFAELKLPDSDLPPSPKQVKQCEKCGCEVELGETYCNDCLYNKI